MNLLLTNSEDATSDYLQRQLSKQGVELTRINTDVGLSNGLFLFDSRTKNISLEWMSQTMTPSEVQSIIFRRPKPLKTEGIEDEHHSSHVADEWSEALEGFLSHVEERCWINHPAKNFVASHKIEQISRARKFGFNVPATVVTNNPRQAYEFARLHPEGVVVKPLARGYIKRKTRDKDSSIYTSLLTSEQYHLLDLINSCPIIIQELIRKKRDVRVTVIDEQICAVSLKSALESGEQILDIRRDNMQGVVYSLLKVPDFIRSAIFKFVNSYSLRFAALDFAILDDDSWVFFENNPNGQWAWLDLEADAGISDLFAKSLKVSDRPA